MSVNSPQNRSIALVALGSNIVSAKGDPAETLRYAIETLKGKSLLIRAQSAIYRTPAFPPGSGSDYANAVIAVEHELEATALLAVLHETEDALGRTRDMRWGPRVIDLDLLACEDLVLPSRSVVETWINLPPELQTQAAPRDLVLPHPRLQDRAFVLIPMADVAPDWRHPVLGKTVREMQAELPGYLCEEVRIYH